MQPMRMYNENQFYVSQALIFDVKRTTKIDGMGLFKFGRMLPHQWITIPLWIRLKLSEDRIIIIFDKFMKINCYLLKLLLLILANYFKAKYTGL